VRRYGADLDIGKSEGQWAAMSEATGHLPEAAQVGLHRELARNAPDVHQPKNDSMRRADGMPLLQYFIPAQMSYAYLRLRHRKEGAYTTAAMKVACRKDADLQELVKAGRLASLMWPLVAFSAFMLGILCAILQRIVGGESAWGTVTTNFFAYATSVSLGVIILVHTRLRSADSSLARNESVVSKWNVPKHWDFWVAVMLGIGLSAFAQAAVSNSS
jgi:hypothetical protein